MAVRVEWDTAAELVLNRIWALGVDEATRVASAVYRFVEAGEGDVRRYAGDARTVRRLQVPPYVIKVAVDYPAGVVRVLSIQDRSS